MPQRHSLSSTNQSQLLHSGDRLLNNLDGRAVVQWERHTHWLDLSRMFRLIIVISNESHGQTRQMQNVRHAALGLLAGKVLTRSASNIYRRLAARAPPARCYRPFQSSLPPHVVACAGYGAPRSAECPAPRPPGGNTARYVYASHLHARSLRQMAAPNIAAPRSHCIMAFPPGRTAQRVGGRPASGVLRRMYVLICNTHGAIARIAPLYCLINQRRIQRYFGGDLDAI